MKGYKAWDVSLYGRVVDFPAILGLDNPIIPVGTIYAMRFVANEWVEFCNNHDRVSRILRWMSFMTIRKKEDGTWERIGTKNEIRELGPVENWPSLDY